MVKDDALREEKERQETQVICVAGWYFLEPLMKVLGEVHASYPVLMVAHREPPFLPFPTVQTENDGLEFGAYQTFLESWWDGQSSVIFMHDDVRATGEAFDQISEMGKGVDQAFIFRDQEQESRNWSMSYGGGVHGRAIYCSGRFLDWLLNDVCVCQEATGYRERHHPDEPLDGTGPHTGFWFDPANHGHTWGPPPVGVRDYNAATIHFAMRCSEASKTMATLRRFHVPEFDPGKRGGW